MREKKTLSPTWKMKKGSVNSLWAQRLELIEEFFKPNIDKAEKITILLDEPDRSLDIPNQATMWRALASTKLSERAQLIIASHSTFAVNVNGANYVEFTPGYLDECRKAINGHPEA